MTLTLMLKLGMPFKQSCFIAALAGTPATSILKNLRDTRIIIAATLWLVVMCQSVH